MGDHHFDPIRSVFLKMSQGVRPSARLRLLINESNPFTSRFPENVEIVSPRDFGFLEKVGLLHFAIKQPH
jgi:hypothetical protein